MSSCMFTLSNWPLYKIQYYATYCINTFKVWLRCTVHAKIGYVLGLPVYVEVVVNFWYSSLIVSYENLSIWRN